MPLGGNDFHVFHADAAQFVGDEFRGFVNVGLVFFQGADARNAQKIFELADKALLILAGEIECRGSHGESFLAWTRNRNERRWIAKRLSITELDNKGVWGPSLTAIFRAVRCHTNAVERPLVVGRTTKTDDFSTTANADRTRCGRNRSFRKHLT